VQIKKESDGPDKIEAGVLQINPSRKVLITGASGFLGRYIFNELTAKGYEVHTIGRSAFDSKNHFLCDLGNEEPNLAGQSYDWIIHSAGKAHVVPRTIGEKEDFFRVNERGIENLFRALDANSIKPTSVSIISTVAVYGVSSGSNITEQHPLGAMDPYGKSKKNAEQIAMNYAEKIGARLSILRLPLIAGKNPPGNLGAMIKGMKNGRYFGIGQSKAKRSIVLAADVAMYLPQLSHVGGVFNLSDGVDVTFKELETLLSKLLKSTPPRSLPFFVAWLAALFGEFLLFFGIHFPINFNTLSKITTDLTFSSEKAKKAGWNPRSVLTVPNEIIE
jgi:GlcNAc-P-P-Und epimerase